ncbi:MAG: hypothetical protein PT977_06165 [Acidobacteriota bacterium]|nr:hypothetical protein [Acidobacteriota bacterium]
MRNRNLTALALASCLATASAAVAQTAAPASGVPWTLISGTTITVKPSAVAAFEESVKKTNAANVKAGVAPSRFWSVGRGGPGFTYLATLRFAKWSEMDDRPTMVTVLKKAYGDVEGPKVWASALGAIDSVSSVVNRVLPSLSSPPANFEAVPAHIRISKVEVHQGMGPKFEAYLAKLKAAQDKVGGTPPVVRYVSALGPASVYTASYYFDKYAQWDGAPAIADVLRKSYGDAEAATLEETARTCVKHLETYVLDYRADLSKP